MKLADLQILLNRADELDEETLNEVVRLAEEISKDDHNEQCQTKFIPFVKAMWPGFIEGRHHKIMADAFERIASGKLKRLIINMPPRHTKSEFASHHLPAWYLGQYPDRQIIQCSNTGDLASDFGRKVRDLVASKPFAKIFPGTSLKADSRAAGKWNTNHRGAYFASGIGGSVTGRGADLLVIDDPHTEQDGAANDPEIFKKAYDWYQSGPRQRLQPDAAIVVVMCMVGDTEITMADGSHKYLRDINPGDYVATYENGDLATARINNFRSSGDDSVFAVRTLSGRIVRANERHPFLVRDGDGQRWVRLKNLNPGDELVSMVDAHGHPGRRPDRESAGHALRGIPITGRIQMHPIATSDTTENGVASNAPLADAGEGSVARVCVADVIRRLTRQGSRLLRKIGIGALRIGTESPSTSTMRSFANRMDYALSAATHHPRKILVPIGMESSVSTTAMIPERSGDFSVTTAISRLDTERPQRISLEPPSTSSFTTDEIISIEFCGVEEVFDVEVDRTENFIANGLVSHNTRWHKGDLTGQILKKAIEEGDSVDQWEVIELPAILPDSGKALWPGYWSLELLNKLKGELEPFKWNAQYQQSPTSAESAIIKKDWWRVWNEPEPPRCQFIIQSWDTAFTKGNRNDYSACTTWGVFYLEGASGRQMANLILLDAYKARLEFPELKREAFDRYRKWEPDALIVEGRASGLPLVFELRERGVPVQEYTPSRGNDKFVRVNSVSDLFSSGIVWAPERKFALDVIEEFADFPAGTNDDLVDSSTQALIRFRQGGFVRMESDYEHDNSDFEPRRHAYY